MIIADITIGERHRRDMGDLAGLADSIKTQGLLQPVGVTPENELVFGFRRLVACRDNLGWTEVDHRIVNVTSIVAGEYAENEVRKDFTPSERVAIKKAIEQQIGSRQGSNQYTTKELQKNFTDAVKPGEQTRDVAARLAGFGNPITAGQAETVVDKGVPELVDAMDKGEIKIAAAADIATKPADEQRKITAMPKKDRKAAVRAIRAGGGSTPKRKTSGKRKQIMPDMPKTMEARLAIRPEVEAGKIVDPRAWGEKLGMSHLQVQTAYYLECQRLEFLTKLEDIDLIDEYEKRTEPRNTETKKRIDPPMQFPNLPTGEEIGEPPPDAPIEVRLAWRDKMGAKVIQFAPRIKQLMNDEANVNQAAHVVRIAVRDDMPSAERFAEGIERMLAHVIKPDAEATGDRRDFAKIAREARLAVESNLDAAIAKLEAYRAVVRKQEGISNGTT